MPIIDSNDPLMSMHLMSPKIMENLPAGIKGMSNYRTYGIWEYISFLDQGL